MRSVRPGTVEGRVAAPPSKSVLQRALILAALAEGRSVIRASRVCADVRAAMRAAVGLGARVEERPFAIEVTPGATRLRTRIGCGESGLCLRLLAPVAALGDRPVTLCASGSLRGRPVGALEGPLVALGARCATAGGFAPVTVRGPLRGGTARVDGSFGSQIVSGLLVALARAPRDSVLSVDGLASPQYVDLTIEQLAAFGGTASRDGHHRLFTVRGGQRLRGADVAVEGDWSGAAFLLVAGAVAGRVTVTGLDSGSSQPDRRVLEALALAGARVEIAGDEVTVGRDRLEAFSFDARDCPDLVPPLAALAASCRGTTAIAGATRLRHKECDRAAAIERELGRIGCDVRVEGDVIRVRGGRTEGGAASACGDHRMAMALAVAGLSSARGVRISGASCVAKSYPGFFEDLGGLGRDAR
jgi:3-phosphoshikimate 1-carboxyvinyltransferase